MGGSCSSDDAAGEKNKAGADKSNTQPQAKGPKLNPAHPPKLPPPPAALPPSPTSPTAPPSPSASGVFEQKSAASPAAKKNATSPTSAKNNNNNKAPPLPNTRPPSSRTSSTPMKITVDEPPDPPGTPSKLAQAAQQQAAAAHSSAVSPGGTVNVSIQIDDDDSDNDNAAVPPALLAKPNIQKQHQPQQRFQKSDYQFATELPEDVRRRIQESVRHSYHVGPDRKPLAAPFVPPSEDVPLHSRAVFVGYKVAAVDSPIAKYSIGSVVESSNSDEQQHNQQQQPVLLMSAFAEQYNSPQQQPHSTQQQKQEQEPSPAAVSPISPPAPDFSPMVEASSATKREKGAPTLNIASGRQTQQQQHQNTKTFASNVSATTAPWQDAGPMRTLYEEFSVQRNSPERLERMKVRPLATSDKAGTSATTAAPAAEQKVQLVEELLEHLHSPPSSSSAKRQQTISAAMREEEEKRRKQVEETIHRDPAAALVNRDSSGHRSAGTGISESFFVSMMNASNSKPSKQPPRSRNASADRAPAATTTSLHHLPLSVETAPSVLAAKTSVVVGSKPPSRSNSAAPVTDISQISNIGSGGRAGAAAAVEEEISVMVSPDDKKRQGEQKSPEPDVRFLKYTAREEAELKAREEIQVLASFVGKNSNNNNSRRAVNSSAVIPGKSAVSSSSSLAARNQQQHHYIAHELKQRGQFVDTDPIRDAVAHAVLSDPVGKRKQHAAAAAAIRDSDTDEYLAELEGEIAAHAAVQLTRRKEDLDLVVEVMYPPNAGGGGGKKPRPQQQSQRNTSRVEHWVQQQPQQQRIPGVIQFGAPAASNSGLQWPAVGFAADGSSFNL